MSKDLTGQHLSTTLHQSGIKESNWWFCCDSKVSADSQLAAERTKEKKKVRKRECEVMESDGCRDTIGWPYWVHSCQPGQPNKALAVRLHLSDTCRESDSSFPLDCIPSSSSSSLHFGEYSVPLGLSARRRLKREEDLRCYFTKEAKWGSEGHSYPSCSLLSTHSKPLNHWYK